MFQKFILRSMLKSKLGSLPEAEQEKMMALVENNPDFFVKIAKEIEAKKSTLGETGAVMAVMKEHEDELRGILGK